MTLITKLNTNGSEMIVSDIVSRKRICPLNLICTCNEQIRTWLKDCPDLNAVGPDKIPVQECRRFGIGAAMPLESTAPNVLDEIAIDDNILTVARAGVPQPRPQSLGWSVIQLSKPFIGIWIEMAAKIQTAVRVVVAGDTVAVNIWLQPRIFEDAIDIRDAGKFGGKYSALPAELIPPPAGAEL